MKVGNCQTFIAEGRKLQPQNRVPIPIENLGGFEAVKIGLFKKCLRKYFQCRLWIIVRSTTFISDLNISRRLTLALKIFETLTLYVGYTCYPKGTGMQFSWNELDMRVGFHTIIWSLRPNFITRRYWNKPIFSVWNTLRSNLFENGRTKIFILGLKLFWGVLFSYLTRKFHFIQLSI